MHVGDAGKRLVDAGLPQANCLVHVAIVAQAQQRPIRKRETDDVSPDAQHEATKAELVAHAPIFPEYHFDRVESVGYGGG